jgi:hypothetical protein
MNLVTRLLTVLARTNILVNGNFSEGTTGWSSIVAGASITGGALVFDGVTSIANGATIAIGSTTKAIAAGLSYKVTYTIVADTTTALSVNVGGTLGTGRTAAGTYTETLVAANANAPTIIARFSTAARTGSIDNIIIRRA